MTQAMSISPSRALRGVLRERGSAISIVLTIAVGVAALTLAFGLADAALWRQPPFADASRLVFVNSTHVTPGSPVQRLRWSYPRIQLMRREARSFASLANYTPTTVTVSGEGAATESVRGEFVSAEYFPTLSVGAERGRLFLPSEVVTASTHPVVLIGHDMWLQRFAGDPAIVGKTLRVNRVYLTIVGVMPAGFRGLSDNAGLWLPSTMAPTLTYPEYLTTDQHFINVVARLEPTVSIADANAEMATLAPSIFAALPIADRDSGQVSSAIVRSLNEVRMEPRIRRSIVLLLAGVALLHLLACTNVISLLLGRAAAKRRETAIRVALGATPWRLLPTVSAESALLVVTGCTLGVLLAYAGSIAIPAPAEMWNTRTFNTALSSFAEPAFGVRSLLFSFALTVATLLLVVWAPATSLVRMDIPSTLRAGSRGSSHGSGSGRKPDIRSAVVTVEVALALMLLVAGGLMIDSFQRMRRTDLGVDASHVLTFELPVPDARVSTAEAPAFIRRILGAITSTPGIVSATVDGGAPVSGSASSTLCIAGRPPARPYREVRAVRYSSQADPRRDRRMHRPCSVIT
jgi:putative ABC transport system permease protein